MSFIRNQAAVLLALLPALPNGSNGGPTGNGKADDADEAGSAAPMGRQGVLELLESGVISTEEALDLLDGIDQTSHGAGEPIGARFSPFARASRPARPGRPARPPRPSRTRGPRGPEDQDEYGDGDERERRSQESIRRDEASVRYFEGRRTLRIQVDSVDGSDVNLALPIGFLETGLKVAERFSPGLLGGDVGTSIRRAIGSGQSGTIIEVNDAAGSRVRIAIE
jgi:hypothetical protein